MTGAAKALRSIPTAGDVGAAAGKAVDTGIAKARSMARSARKVYGGGKTYKGPEG